MVGGDQALHLGIEHLLYLFYAGLVVKELKRRVQANQLYKIDEPQVRLTQDRR